jgi:FAD-dependent urate hydroxylase
MGKGSSDAEDQFYFFFDASPPQTTERVPPEAIQAELREHFKGWHEAVQVAIEKLDPTKVARVEIHDTDPLPTLIDPSGRAVLVGDAAHATAPDLGQGGCQAMEDAFVVAELMEKEGLTGDAPVSEEALKRVVQAYQEARAERVRQLVLRARKRAEVTHALDGMQQTEGTFFVWPNGVLTCCRLVQRAQGRGWDAHQ